METTETALAALWAFASGMVEKHGADGDNTMTDAEHKAWQEAAGATNYVYHRTAGTTKEVIKEAKTNAKHYADHFANMARYTDEGLCHTDDVLIELYEEINFQELAAALHLLGWTP